MRKSLPWLMVLGLVGTAQAGGLPTYQIDVSDGVFTPARLEVPAGQRFKIIVRNVGQGPIEFESTPLRVEKVLSPGAQSFVVVHPLKPGRYPFFDEFRMDLPEGEIIAR
jgi:hypothetical protein